MWLVLNDQFLKVWLSQHHCSRVIKSGCLATDSHFWTLAAFKGYMITIHGLPCLLPVNSQWGSQKGRFACCSGKSFAISPTWQQPSHLRSCCTSLATCTHSLTQLQQRTCLSACLWVTWDLFNDPSQWQQRRMWRLLSLSDLSHVMLRFAATSLNSGNSSPNYYC